MIKVFIADDHFVVRNGLKQILSDEKDIDIIGEASNAEEILSRINPNNLDILILDITMPGKNGLDFLIEIKNKYPSIKIIMLSMHSEKEIVSRALKTGANGYINKDAIPEELVEAIRKVHKGQIFLSSSLRKDLIDELSQNNSHEKHNQLSEREFQVFCLLASGNSLKEIAEELSINRKTVSTYRTRILEKFHLKSNSDLVVYALHNKIILPM